MMLSHQLQILMETRTYEKLSPDSAASALREANNAKADPYNSIPT